MISLVQMLSGDIDLACLSIASVPFVDDVLIGKEASQGLFFGGKFELPDAWRARLAEAAGRPPRFMEWDMHANYAETFDLAETPIRNALSHLVPPGNWILHLDSDEVALNGEEFFRWLRSFTTPNSYCFTACDTQAVFKVVGSTALVASSKTAWTTPVVTSRTGRYVRGRDTGEKRLASPLRLLHWSYGRPRAAIVKKLSWSARYMGGEEKAKRLLDLWDSVTLENFGAFVDFWPHGDGRAWHRLRAVPLADALAGRI